MYSDGGKATVTGAVETVVALPCRVMGAVASIMSRVRAPCGGSLSTQAEWGPAPEPGRGRASRKLRLMIVVSTFLCVFYCSDLGIPYYGTQQRG